MMKPFFSLALTLAMLTFSGCSGQSTIPEATPAQLTQLYTQAITSQDSQITQSIPVFSQFTRESTPILDSLDLDMDEMTAFALKISTQNDIPYAIAAIMPARGETEDVLDDLRELIRQKRAYFFSDSQEKQIAAQSARLEVLQDGTVLMVMAEDQNRIFEHLSSVILNR